MLIRPNDLPLKAAVVGLEPLAPVSCIGHLVIKKNRKHLGSPEYFSVTLLNDTYAYIHIDVYILYKYIYIYIYYVFVYK